MSDKSRVQLLLDGNYIVFAYVENSWDRTKAPFLRS